MRELKENHYCEMGRAQKENAMYGIRVQLLVPSVFLIM